MTVILLAKAVGHCWQVALLVLECFLLDISLGQLNEPGWFTVQLLFAATAPQHRLSLSCDRTTRTHNTCQSQLPPPPTCMCA